MYLYQVQNAHERDYQVPGKINKNKIGYININLHITTENRMLWFNFKICIHKCVNTTNLNSPCKMKYIYYPTDKYFSAHGANVK